MCSQFIYSIPLFVPLPFRFGGKEWSKLFSDYDFVARYYSTSHHRFSTMDPLAEKYYHLSPYAYCGGNPVRFVDPTGTNPIYSIDGYFLGTDDTGLKGDYIIMEKSFFRQGMSNSDALKSQYSEALPEEVKEKIISHYNQLSSRPDWDGYITLDEANEWYRTGKGASLFVDINKIDLSFLYSYGTKSIGKVRTVDMFAVRSINDALVYGHLTVKNYPSDSVRAFSDFYDFDIKRTERIRSLPRNILTRIGGGYAGKGTGFEINIYGEKKLKPAYPWIK